MELRIKPRSATLNIVLGSIAFVLLVALVVLNAVVTGKFVVGGAIMGLLVGGSFGIFIGIVRHRWRDKPIVTIDARGVTAHPHGIGLIPWETISKAEVRRMFLVKQLVVESNRPLRRVPYRTAMGLGLAVVKKGDLSRLSLGLGPFACRPEEVSEAIRRYRPAG